MSNQSKHALGCALIGSETQDGWKVLGVTPSPGRGYPKGTYLTLTKFGESSRHEPIEAHAALLGEVVPC